MSIKEERTGVWVIFSFVGLFSSTALSVFLMRVGYEWLAMVLFLWLPLITIVVLKFLDRPLLRKYLELDDYGQWILRKDAPQIIHILLGLAPIMATLMVGYVFAHLFKHGSI